MAVYSCPKGHNSTDNDYCSDCGTKIDASGSLGAANFASSIQQSVDISQVKPSIGSMIDCPDCGTPHDPTDGIFCEICGYNFKTKAHGEIPIDPVEIPPAVIPMPIEIPPLEILSNLAPVTLSSTVGISASSATIAWQLEITIDPSLAAPESPPPPSQGPIVITLSKPMSLIGRTSETRANYPEVALDFDEAVSSRHAVLNLTNSSLTLRDIGSSNGTYVNGIEIKPMVDIQLKPGDVFNLGHWTKVTIRSVL
jgi:FHA domain